MLTFIIPSKRLSYCILVVSIVGLIVSIYALYIENKASGNDDYHASCDINEVVSCSRVFLSEQAHVFSYLGLVPKDSSLDLPNAAYGILFYILVTIISRLMREYALLLDVLLFISTFSMVLSAYLAYVLATMSTICVICLSTYICNFFIFFSCISCMTIKKKKVNTRVVKEIMANTKKNKNKSS